MWWSSPEIINFTKSILSVAASLAASLVLFRSTASNLIPDGVYHYFQNLLNRFSPELTVIIEEFEGLMANHMFESAQTYLGSKLTPFAKKFKVQTNHPSRPIFKRKQNFSLPSSLVMQGIFFVSCFISVTVQQ